MKFLNKKNKVEFLTIIIHPEKGEILLEGNIEESDSRIFTVLSMALYKVCKDIAVKHRCKDKECILEKHALLNLKHFEKLWKKAK